MASTGGQQPVPTPPTAVPAATSTTTHEIQAQNPNTHLSTSSTNPTQNLPPHPPSLSTFANTTTTTTTTTSTFNGGKKRPLDCGGLLQSSPYFKMRVLVKDLRPLVLEVLRAPDFQNCEAAEGVQEKLKLMLDLCKPKTLENVPMAKCNSGGGIYEPVQLHRSTRPSDQPLQPDRSFVRPAEDRRHPVGNNPEKPESNRISGTYIVGGSAFGWNFITFHGTKPEYYGRTKEAFRAGK